MNQWESTVWKRLEEKEWNEDCQKAFDKIKTYLLNPPVLVKPEPGRPSQRW